LILHVGTVFRWNRFPSPRYGGETKARWFIYLGETGQFSQIASVYLCTTTTKADHFKTGGSRERHSHFKFEVRQFPEFEKDCILDFDDPPQPIEKTNLLNKSEDIDVRGRLSGDIIRMIYKRYLQSGSCSKRVLLDIHESINRDGISGLKKPK